MIPITDEMQIPFCHHRYIIGQKGNEVRKLMEQFDVTISIPPASEGSDIVKISGAQTNVDRAKHALDDRVKQLERERIDKVPGYTCFHINNCKRFNFCFN